MLLKENQIFAGRYRLLERLGIGGFAVVWKAEDQHVENIVVALKIYAPEQGMDKNGLSLFRKEYSKMLHLQHPNILAARHFDIYDGHPYLVLSFCSGGSLAQILIEEYQLPEDEIFKVVFQICKAISYLNLKGISHQDIKPGNILKNGDDYLLSDFGISERLRNSLRHSVVEKSAMTVSYAPPERFAGNTLPHPKSDIFSLGVVIFEMASGSVPWMGAGGAYLNANSGFLELPDEYSQSLEKLMNEMLSFEPDQRPGPENIRRRADAYLTGEGNHNFSSYSNHSRKTVQFTQNDQNSHNQQSKKKQHQSQSRSQNKNFLTKNIFLLFMVFLFSGLGYFVYTFWNSNSDDSISDKINHHDDSYFNQKGSFFLSATDIILRETPSIKGKIVDVVRNSDQEVYILSEKDATNPGEAILLQETVVHSNGKRLVLTKGKALQVLFKRGAKTKVEVNTSDFGLISAYLDNSVIKSIANEKWIKIRVKSTGESGWILKQFVYSRE